MDGGRRLLRSIIGFGWAQGVPALASPRQGAVPANAGSFLPAVQKSRLPATIRPVERRALQANAAARWARLLARRGTGLALAAIVIGGAGISGAVRGGHYAAFVASNGALGDVIARSVGLGVSAVVISSDNGMSDAEILKLSGITIQSSLVFLNAAEVREKLKSVPLIREASVRKLYPDRLVIDVEGRQPFGLWQKDGKVAVIAKDGTAIDAMRDDRFAELPFVVGEGANERIAEYISLLDAAGDMRSKIRAGTLVSARRWNLKMFNGIDVRLPEIAPARAVAQLAVLDHDARVLDKDLVWIDLRQSGRMIARLSADAAAARADALAAKKRSKAGQT